MILALSSGCSGTTGRLADAGARIGAARAGMHLPAQPEECARDEPHAPLSAGASAIVVLDRERSALDRANASKRRCYDFNQSARR